MTGHRAPPADAPRLLSGGNPQIPKGYGDGPVKAYIAAMPGWKRDTGEQIDAIIERTVPSVRRAVKYNSPLYGAPHEDAQRPEWFMSVHCMTRYVKVAFLNGGSLKPRPPVASKQPGVRYLHLHEGEAIDQAQFADWVRQAIGLPGEKL
jgi:hypothetical protein